MRKILLSLCVCSFLFAKVDYSQMSNEELIALIGYVSKDKEVAFNKELAKRIPTFSKKEKEIYQKNISKKNFADYLQEIEDAQLSDAFWNAELIQRLNTSSSTSPVFNVFLAAQCYLNEKGFLSKDITVKNLIEQRGDVHHIFPRDILKKKGLTRGQYNQVANYVYTQSEINIKIGNKPIEKYLTEVKAQCNGSELVYGGITELSQLYNNLKQNAIPDTIFEMTIEDYQKFLMQRRVKMAEKMRDYYEKI